MGFLGLGKKDRIVDLAERYRKTTASEAKPKEGNASGMGFLSGLVSPASTQNDALVEQATENSVSDAERKQKL